MVFWLGILVAIAFAWFCLQIGFYETWAVLFNIVISVYLGIFLRPLITELLPAAADTPYGNGLTMLATAAAVFLLLQ